MGVQTRRKDSRDVSKRRTLRFHLERSGPVSDENKASSVVQHGDLADTPQHHLLQKFIRVELHQADVKSDPETPMIGPRDLVCTMQNVSRAAETALPKVKRRSRLTVPLLQVDRRYTGRVWERSDQREPLG